LRGAEACLVIDLKPALTSEQLDRRLQRDFAANLNKDLTNALGGLVPSKLRAVIVALSGIAGERKINSLTKAERQTLGKLLKNLTMTVSGARSFEEAIITQGGVSVKEIHPATMESKLVKNLYFAGEVIDVDALTGGFNLQIAWSTGYLAGKSAGGI
jgi:predicted Rossmann fold flavoprotein